MAFSFNKLMNVYMMWFHAFLREKYLFWFQKEIYFMNIIQMIY